MKEINKFAPSAIFEGIVSVRALLSAYESTFNDRRIENLYYDEDKIKKSPKEFAFLSARGKTLGFNVITVPHSVIDEMTLGTSHGGIAASCTERSIPQLNKDSVIPGGFYCMLEGIEDPYNFGYALRSLYAAGASGVILSPRNWMSAAGVVCRASAGASELFDMFVSDGAEAAAIMKSAGYRVICAEINDSVPVWEADLSLPVFLVVGGEKRGISSALISMADSIVRLDYGRDFPAALSAASAASILGFEVLRQNKK